MSETTIMKMTVAKCTTEELENVRNYLQNIERVLKDNDCYEDDDPDVNKEIADVARQLPGRSFIVPLNLGILLDNYQDQDSDIIEHPKWIKYMFHVLTEIDKYLSDNPQNTIAPTSILHDMVKKCLSDEE